MYCPKCSQQSASGQVRYCARCGFPLGIVSELLSHDGITMERETVVAPLPLLRRKSVRTGAKLIFFSLILVPVAIGLGVIFDSPGPLLISLVLFFIGLVQILYALIFGESLLPQRPQKQPATLSAAERRLNLPPSQSEPVTVSAAKHVNTAEMVQPPSVAEHTTKLLEDNQ
jgi:hypothetical protein